MRHIARILLLVYGVVLIVGGVIGYTKAGSMPSLLAGAISGVLCILCFGLALKRPRTGMLIGAAIAAGLVVERGMAYFKTKAFMPSGMLVALSVLMVIVLVLGASRPVGSHR